MNWKKANYIFLRNLRLQYIVAAVAARDMLLLLFIMMEKAGLSQRVETK
jgi:hypothetical protein